MACMHLHCTYFLDNFVTKVKHCIPCHHIVVNCSISVLASMFLQGTPNAEKKLMPNIFSFQILHNKYGIHQCVKLLPILVTYLLMDHGINIIKKIKHELGFQVSLNVLMLMFGFLCQHLFFGVQYVLLAICFSTRNDCMAL